MQILKGEFVAAQDHYFDGWAYGTNLISGAQGAFPLSIVTSAKAGRNYKLVLVNVVNSIEGIVGKELLDAALLSYPLQIEVHHIIHQTSNILDGVPGFIRYGRLDEIILTEILGKVRCDVQNRVSRKAVVCGPCSFNAMVSQALVEGMGWSDADVKSLSDTFVN